MHPNGKVSQIHDIEDTVTNVMHIASFQMSKAGQDTPVPCFTMEDVEKVRADGFCQIKQSRKWN